MPAIALPDSAYLGITSRLRVLSPVFLSSPKRVLEQLTPFHRVIPNFMIQGGDIVKGNGMGGECIFGAHFEDENLDGVHDAPGLVSMANAGPDSNSSQFFITTAPAPHLDKKHVMVGRVIEGMDVIRRVELVPTNANDAPKRRVIISDCGSDCTTPIPFKAADPKKGSVLKTHHFVAMTPNPRSAPHSCTT